MDTDGQVLDWCDRLYLTVQPEEERRVQFWPARPASLAGLLHEYALGSEQVARRVLRAMARVLGFGEGFFLGHVGEKGGTYARFTYYPPCPRPDLVYGLKPHTDNSVVTVLLLDRDVGGLQVLLRGPGPGRWVDVPVLARDELLVVVGEEMEIMSNAVFRAPTHRVVTSGRERMSLVLFYQPEPHKDLQPAEGWARTGPRCTGGSRPRPSATGSGMRSRSASAPSTSSTSRSTTRSMEAD